MDSIWKLTMGKVEKIVYVILRPVFVMILKKLLHLAVTCLLILYVLVKKYYAVVTYWL